MITIAHPEYSSGELNISKVQNSDQETHKSDLFSIIRYTKSSKKLSGNTQKIGFIRYILKI